MVLTLNENVVVGLSDWYASSFVDICAVIGPCKYNYTEIYIWRIIS
jgi:hypothetical protein